MMAMTSSPFKEIACAPTQFYFQRNTFLMVFGSLGKCTRARGRHAADHTRCPCSISTAQLAACHIIRQLSRHPARAKMQQRPRTTKSVLCADSWQPPTAAWEQRPSSAAPTGYPAARWTQPSLAFTVCCRHKFGPVQSSLKSASLLLLLALETSLRRCCSCWRWKPASLRRCCFGWRWPPRCGRAPPAAGRQEEKGAFLGARIFQGGRGRA